MTVELSKVVVVHSLFRSGSTYLFNKLRDNNCFYCYYEPLHHEIINIRKDTLDVWNVTRRRSHRMKHPHLKKPHFYEYGVAFKEGEDRLPHFDPRFSYNEYYSVKNSTGMRSYINNLICSTPDGLIPLLQFNRTSMRIPWFKDNYKNSLNVYLLRNPRDQFDSYYRIKKINNNYFLAINCLLIMQGKNKFKDEELLRITNKIYYLSSLEEPLKDIKHVLAIVPALTKEEHYRIFIELWKMSYCLAYECADLIMDMDSIGTSSEYTDLISTLMNNYNSNCELDFSDYRLKKYSKHVLPNSCLSLIEKERDKLYSCNEVIEYLDSLNNFSQSKNCIYTMLNRINR